MTEDLIFFKGFYKLEKKGFKILFSSQLCFKNIFSILFYYIFLEGVGGVSVFWMKTWEMDKLFQN